MILLNYILLEVAISFLGLCGLLVARYIYKRKRVKETPFVCPVGFDCHTVVHSNYSKFLGIPVEILGMVYYALIFISYFFLVFSPLVLSNNLIWFLIIVSLVSTLFSIYLIGVQIFILKKGCSWCIISALISFSIFILTLLTYDIDLVVKILSSLNF